MADVTLFPTAVFAHFMLPQFFGITSKDLFKPSLMRWFDFMCNDISISKEIKEEIEVALIGWRENKRWDAIIAEIK